MKIIRVASSDQLTGLFSNEFSEAITLPPQSKIALLNGMFAINSKSIFVPADTTISFQTKSGAGTFTATLPEGSYTQTALATTLRAAMNQALTRSTMGTVCFVWNVTLNNNLLSLNFMRSASQDMDFTNLNNIAVNKVSGTNKFSATSDGSSDTTGQFKNFAYSNSTVLPYNSFIRIRPYRTNSLSNAVPFIFGLLLDKPDNSKAFLSAADFMFGIESDGANVKYIYNGAVVAGQTYPVGGNAGDVNPIKTTGINIVFTRSAVNYTDVADTLHTIPLDFDAKGFIPAIGLRKISDDIRNTFYTKNPYENSSIVNAAIAAHNYPLPTVLHLDDSLVGGTKLNKTIVTVSMSENMRTVLGYDGDPTPLQAISGAYTAQTSITDSTTPTSITVECPNLGGMIQSYDGISQKRRPIVAVIPAMEQKNGMLTYQPGYPPFIDLNNRFPIQLSKLEVRLLSSFDDTEVNLEHPGTSMTFALDHNIPQKPTD